MKNKLILLLIFAVFIPVSAFSQGADSPEDIDIVVNHRILTGGSIGVMKFNMIHNVDSDPAYTFTFGGSVSYLFRDYLSIALEVNYSQTSYKNLTDTLGNSLDINADYISVPLIFCGQYIFKDFVAPFIGAGIGFNFLLSANAVWAEADYLGTKDFRSQMPSFEPEAVGMIGVSFFTKAGVFSLSARYSYPLITQISSDAFSTRDFQTSNINVFVSFQLEVFSDIQDDEYWNEDRINQFASMIPENYPFLQVSKSYFSPDGTYRNSNIGFIISDLDSELLAEFTIRIYDSNGEIFHVITCTDPSGQVAWNGKNDQGEYLRSFSEYKVTGNVKYTNGLSLELVIGDEITFQTGPVLMVIEESMYKIRIPEMEFISRGENELQLSDQSKIMLESTYQILRIYSEYDIIVSLLLDDYSEQSVNDSNIKARIIRGFLSNLGVQFRDVVSAGLVTQELKSEEAVGEVVDIFIFPRF